MEVSMLNPSERKAVRHYFEFFKAMHKLNGKQRRQVYFRLKVLNLITDSERIQIEAIRKRITETRQQ